jgi:hypothetical protein
MKYYPKSISGSTSFILKKRKKTILKKYCVALIVEVYIYICHSTNWNPVGSRILLVQIEIPICTGFKPV